MVSAPDRDRARPCVLNSRGMRNDVRLTPRFHMTAALVATTKTSNSKSTSSFVGRIAHTRRVMRLAANARRTTSSMKAEMKNPSAARRYRFFSASKSNRYSAMTAALHAMRHLIIRSKNNPCTYSDKRSRFGRATPLGTARGSSSSSRINRARVIAASATEWTLSPSPPFNRRMSRRIVALLSKSSPASSSPSSSSSFPFDLLRSII